MRIVVYSGIGNMNVNEKNAIYSGIGSNINVNEKNAAYLGKERKYYLIQKCNARSTAKNAIYCTTWNLDERKKGASF